jgi:O-antigen/teichoic acid export membrane protein
VKTLLFFALFIQITSSLIIAAIFYFWSTFIAENYFKTLAAKETLQVFAFFFIGLNIFQTLSQFFLAIQDTLFHKSTEFLRMWFIMISLLFIFFWGGGSLLEYSFAWLIWLYIWIIFALIIFIKKYYVKYLKNTSVLKEIWFIKPIIKYAGLVVVWTSAATLLSQIDMQMIIYILGTTEAGYYTNYLSIISIPFMLIGPMFAFLFPVISEMYWNSETKKIQVIKDIFSKNLIIIWIIFNVFFYIFAEIIAYTLFWEKFIESGKILQYSILLLVFNFLFQINFNILAWIGKVKERVKIIFIAIIFNFIMNIILINIIWIYWAALATWIWWLLIFILSEYYIEEIFRIKIYWRNVFKNIFFATIYSVIFINLILPYFNDKSRLDTLILLSLCFCLWTLMIVLVNLKAFKNLLIIIKSIKNS